MADRFAPLRTEDADLNRVQDAIARRLNPLLAKVGGVAPAVTGSTGGNAALKSLIAALASMGLIVDKTS